MWLEFGAWPTWLQIALGVVLLPLVFAIRLWQIRWPRRAKVLSIAASFVTFVAVAGAANSAGETSSQAAEPQTVAQNGKILYFLNWESEDRVLRSVGADGRDDRRIAATGFRPDVDADGDCIDDHTNSRVCFPLEDAAWSPDGGRVAYSRTGGGLYVAQEDGSHPRRVARGWIDGFDWSPDSRQLVYVGGNFKDQLYLTSASVARPRLLLTLTVGIFLPRWSPNGARILFAKSGGSTPRESLWTIGVDGRGARRLASGDIALIAGAEWSPNGKRVAFVANHGASALTDLFVINRDGSGQRLLTRGGAASLDSGSPRWSPDGRQIAFTGLRSCATPDHPDCELEPMMLVALSGGPAVPVGDESDLLEFNPVWSPDGRKLAFYQYGGPAHPQGIVVKVIGTPNLVPIVSGDVLPIDWQRGR